MHRPKTTHCLIETLAEITSLAKSLNVNQLQTPTDCPGWNVQDNLSHIISIESWLLGNEFTAHKADDISNTKNELGVLNENEVDLRRSYNKSQLIEELESVTEPRMQYLKNLTQEDLSAPAWTPIGQQTLEDQCLIRLLDCWAHMQDINNALNLNFDDVSTSSALALNYSISTLPKTFAKSIQDNNGLFKLSVLTHSQLDFSENIFNKFENGYTFMIAKENGRGAFVHEPYEPLSSNNVVDETVNEASTSHKTLISLLLGRKNYQQVKSDVKVSGNQNIVEQVLTNLNFMI